MPVQPIHPTALLSLSLFLSACGPVREAGTDLYADPLPRGSVSRLGTARLRQNSYIGCLAFSPDGRRLAVGLKDTSILL